MRMFILCIGLSVAAIATAKPPSVSIAVPAESWTLCKTVWPIRGMDVTLGEHPRMLTPSGDTVVVATHPWPPGDVARMVEMRADYGWPVVVSRDSLTVVIPFPEEE